MLNDQFAKFLRDYLIFVFYVAALIYAGDRHKTSYHEIEPTSTSALILPQLPFFFLLKKFF